MNMEESIELFQLELTRTQLKALTGLLPQGFSLEPVSKHKTSISSNPTKKIFTNVNFFKFLIQFLIWKKG